GQSRTGENRGSGSGRATDGTRRDELDRSAEKDASLVEEQRFSAFVAGTIAADAGRRNPGAVRLGPGKGDCPSILKGTVPFSGAGQAIVAGPGQGCSGCLANGTGPGRPKPIGTPRQKAVGAWGVRVLFSPPRPRRSARKAIARAADSTRAEK